MNTSVGVRNVKCFERSNDWILQIRTNLMFNFDNDKMRRRGGDTPMSGQFLGTVKDDTFRCIKQVRKLVAICVRSSYRMHVLQCYKPVWNLEVEKKETALVGTSVRTSDGRLPMTAMSVKGRRLNTLWGVCTQRLQFASEPAVAPRVFLYRRCALKRKM